MPSMPDQGQEAKAEPPSPIRLPPRLPRDARREETPIPPMRVLPFLKTGALTSRPDSRRGRLTAALSIELCKEYTDEERVVPELAIRFQVPVNSVRNALTGKTWAKHTTDVRPRTLRPEPERTKKAKPPAARKPEEKPAPPPMPQHITVTRLKGEFGWNDRLITKHLGLHDKEAPNPHYRSAAPMRLFNLDRINDTLARNPQIHTELQKNLDAKKRGRHSRWKPYCKEERNCSERQKN